MITAICFFLVGAGAGVFMLIRHVRKRRLPGWVAIAHGVVGATGFALLLLFCVREPAVVIARYGLGILVGAIALGCVNVIYHLRGVRHRLALIAAHALFAVAGVGTLAYGAIRPAAPPTDVRPEPAPMAPTREPLLANAAPAQPLLAGAPATPAVAAPHAARHPLGPGWTDQRVLFATARTSADAASLTAIAAVARALQDDPAIELVEVQGHADARGADSANLALTQTRAESVARALVAHGVAPSRLRSVGYGSRCPARVACRGSGAPGDCRAEDALHDDRRVTFVVVASGGERFGGPLACDAGGGS
jgi:outer membrane protein OmpA-like peptidoglycan-associated protein